MNARRTLRELLARPGLVVMPGAYDALSARLIEAEGYEAIVAGGYAGIGSMLAQPDMGQSNVRDYADHYARICDAVDIPVYVDADTGFGGVHNIRQAVRAFERPASPACSSATRCSPTAAAICRASRSCPVEQMLARIKAALDARRDPGSVDRRAHRRPRVEGLDAAIERCQLFMEAGADMAKPMGVDTLDDIKRVLREVKSPHMANISQAAGLKHHSLADLEEAGVSAVILPSVTLFAAAHAVRHVLRALKRDNGLANVGDDLLPLDDYYELVGLKEQMAREQRYDQGAAAMLRSRAATE